ncbi:MAG: Maltodextrin phosphorylase, partial [Pseudomonadota bacterium]
IALLGRVSQERLDAAAGDDAYVAQLDAVLQAFRSHLSSTSTWFLRHGAPEASGSGTGSPAEQFPGQRIAYFSAEFGLTEAVPIYSGGLGVLAGDHLKSASDLGLPLVAVGLLYHEAFHQYINADGWQQEVHPRTELSQLPIERQLHADGTPVRVEVELPGRTLFAHVWRLEVGRVPLLLLDAQLPENAGEDQRITDRLYGGDLDMRIRQELLLGIGGLRALEALGLRPAVCHMNEGHSAFLALERVRLLMQERGLAFREARELAAAGSVFTTHTPVPAGNDRFPPEMVDRYLGDWYARLGLTRDAFLGLGRETPSDHEEHFCMTVLALKLAAKANGVAKLHGEVSRQMWKRVFPEVPTHEVPIGSVTNGVHQRSFLSPDMRRLFDSHLGPKWVSDPDDPATWERLDRVPPEELWRAHERGRERVVAFARRRLAAQLQRRGAGAREVAAAAEVLDPKALTIGFARRFATYKRAALITRDAERLSRLLNDADRPVQILFSGKAHQKDDPGKELIRKIVQLAGRPEFRHRIVFLEDYDLNVARHLVQGVDIWLNTPLRPLEASGTSGMKAVVNGAIHVSVLDGWWAEGYDPSVGWAIGEAEEYADRDLAERMEADMLYHLLEHEIVPRFYDRGRDGLPREWVALMKSSMRKLAPFFNTHRMVREYFETSYRPAVTRLGALSAGNDERARRLAAWKERVSGEWGHVSVRAVDGDGRDITVGEPLRVTARVELGGLTPDDVAVQLFHGPVNPDGALVGGEGHDLAPNGRDGAVWSFEGSLRTRHSGRYGWAVRIVPRHPDLATPFDFVPVKWS